MRMPILAAQRGPKQQQQQPEETTVCLARRGGVRAWRAACWGAAPSGSLHNERDACASTGRRATESLLAARRASDMSGQEEVEKGGGVGMGGEGGRGSFFMAGPPFTLPASSQAF